MSIYILGISAFYHDSAEALIRDGEIVAAAQEERFTRRKQDPEFPSKTDTYCLHKAGITTAQLDCAVFYENPFVKFERLLETYLAFAPEGFQSFIEYLKRVLQIHVHNPLILQAKDRTYRLAEKARFSGQLLL